MCHVTRALVCLTFLSSGCGTHTVSPGDTVADRELAERGTVEVTARLVEVPEGAVFKRDLYHYATVLKYEVRKVHRGDVRERTIYVGHFDPWKPRSGANHGQVKDIGGNLRQFRAGAVHRLALSAPIEDFYLGGIVNKYFGKSTEPIYWAVWTNLVEE